MLLDLLKGNITEQEYCSCNDVKIVYKKLPKKIYGFIHRYRDINVITINWYMSQEKKKYTLLHEFAHLELKHIDKNIFEFKIEDIEDEADEYIKNIMIYGE